jgi:formylglycine-generating enzyme required for sulfatase activity
MIRLGLKVVRCRRNLVLDLGFPQSRLGYGPSYHYENLGFRCLKASLTYRFYGIRGGGWRLNTGSYRAAYRSAAYRSLRGPSFKTDNLSFRCARNA